MSGSQITYRATARVVSCYVSDATFNSNGNNGSIIIIMAWKGKQRTTIVNGRSVPPINNNNNNNENRNKNSEW